MNRAGINRTGKARSLPVRAPQRLWDLSSDLMGVTDAEGRLRAMNQAWTTVLGWSEAELLGDAPPMIVHPDDRANAEAELARLADGAETIGFESRLRTRGGDYRRFSWRASAGDSFTYVVGRDVTERAAREEAARHAQKMEAVGQLTGGIAHDFNNLLTIVRSSVEFLKKPDLPESRRARYVEAIDDAVGRAIRVTQQLLAFARRQRLEPEVFDVAERIADVSELLRQVVGPGVRVETVAECAGCRVEADLCQFETALMNLAINARDAMGGQGELVITARAVAGVPAVRGHAATAGEFIAVSVRDTGEGIAEDALPRIFEPFYTTKEVGKGTGLGLSQVYGFVKQSGGGVDVKSAPGHGAEFTIYLPRSAAPTSPAARERVADPEPARDAAAPALKALVVEDNEDVGRFCTAMLRDLGYRPVWARNAGEAIAALENEAATFDLVFTDVVMPGMSGVEFAEHIRRLQPALPVLLTSGYSAVLAEEGARGFPLLAKPYSASDLERALAKVARRARL